MENVAPVTPAPVTPAPVTPAPPAMAFSIGVDMMECPVSLLPCCLKGPSTKIRPRLNLLELQWRKLKKLEIFMLKNSYNTLHKTGVRACMGVFNISEIFVFINLLHSNYYKLVVFCGRSLI